MIMAGMVMARVVVAGVLMASVLMTHVPTTRIIVMRVVIPMRGRPGMLARMRSSWLDGGHGRGGSGYGRRIDIL